MGTGALLGCCSGAHGHVGTVHECDTGHCPNAENVYVKFHVVAGLSKVIDIVRNAEAMPSRDDNETIDSVPPCI